VVEDYESSAGDYEHLLDDLVEIEELYDEYGQEFDELQEEY
jgi:hypothetical protein